MHTRVAVVKNVLIISDDVLLKLRIMMMLMILITVRPRDTNDVYPFVYINTLSNRSIFFVHKNLQQS